MHVSMPYHQFYVTVHEALSSVDTITIGCQRIFTDDVCSYMAYELVGLVLLIAMIICISDQDYVSV